MNEQEESTFVSHEQCDACGSSDANSLYSDGHSFCFSCQKRTPADGEQKPSAKPAKTDSNFLSGDYMELRSRRLTEQTCRKFGYFVTTNSLGEPIQVAEYKDEKGKKTGQKIRTKDKDFPTIGKINGLFGMHLWSSGRKLVVCEGELDAMSVSQIQQHKFATISVRNGAQGAKKNLLENIDYLSGFQEIILMFDMDDAGQKAAIECAEVLPIGKVKIAVLPHKDANECLVKGEAGAIINAIHQAADYRPDGIVQMSDMRETVATPDAESPFKYPYPRLNFMTKGMRGITTLVSGSGCGKSTLVREIAYHLHMTGSTVGMLMLEENTKRTSQGLVGLHINRNIAVDPEAASKDEIEAGFDDLVSNGEIYLFDHVGTFDLDIICSRIRYMKHGLGCDVVFLDHISILVSSYAGNQGDNERVLIDHIMHTLTALCVEIDLALVLVSHLKRPKSERGHEGGDKAQLSQLRGSHSLAQLAWFCIALNVDEEDPTSGKRQLTILKNRHTGFLGSADTLQYNSDTGRLMAVDDNFGF
tara:strand:+ start:262 stop:1851 length:1590 start_codon:yes stop_codon:yes gene_type:complete